MPQSSHDLEAPARTPVALLGPGRVGRSFVSQLRSYQEIHEDPRLDLVCIADSSGCISARNGNRIEDDQIDRILSLKADNRSLSQLEDVEDPADWLSRYSSERPSHAPRPILVDTSAGATQGLVRQARASDWRVVLANKVPLTGKIEDFRILTDDPRDTRWEATVAAALPVVETLRGLADRRDAVQRVEGCVSGTLGFVTSRLSEGERLSRVVAEASSLGYVEPDPREDLSGRDTARKALIVARMLGLSMDLEDVGVEGLYPREWDALPLREFLDRLPELDDGLAGRSVGAAMSGRALRYRFSIVEGRLSAALDDLSPKHPLARVPASDSIVLFETATFNAHPLILSGRGGGPAATAGCVLGDLIQLARGR